MNKGYRENNAEKRGRRLLFYTYWSVSGLEQKLGRSEEYAMETAQRRPF